MGESLNIQHQRVSELMDGESVYAQNLEQLSLLFPDKESLSKWERYHLIRDVLQEDAPLHYDIADRVRNALDKEPTVLAPQNRTPIFKRMFKPVVGLGIAASVLFVSVLSYQALLEPASPLSAPQFVVNKPSAPLAQPTQVLADVSPKSVKRVSVPAKIRPQFEHYMFNHAQNEPNELKPPVRLVGYGNQ